MMADSGDDLQTNLQTSDDNKELNTDGGGAGDDDDVVMKEEVKGEIEDLDGTFASDRGAPNFLAEGGSGGDNNEEIDQENDEQGQGEDEDMDTEKNKADDEEVEVEEDDIIGPKCDVDPGRKDRSGTFKVFSANLPHKSTAETVRKIFEPHGKVAFVELFQNRTYAFIFMENEVAGEKAIQELHEKELEEGSGKNLKVSKSDNEDPPPVPVVKLSVKNISESISAKKLRDLFSTYGLVVYCEIAGSTGIVALESVGDIRSAINEMNGYELEGYQISVKAQLSKEETHYKILKRREQAISAMRKRAAAAKMNSPSRGGGRTRGFHQRTPSQPSWGTFGPGPWGARPRPVRPPPMGYGFGMRGPPRPFHPAFRGGFHPPPPNLMRTRMPLRRPPDFYQQQQQQYNDYEEYEEYDNYNEYEEEYDNYNDYEAEAEDEGYNNYSRVPPSYENNRRGRGGGDGWRESNTNNNKNRSASNSWVGSGGGYGRGVSKGQQGNRRGLGFKGNKGGSGGGNNSSSGGGKSMLHLHRQRQQEQQQQQPRQQQQQQQPRQQQQIKSLFQNIDSVSQSIQQQIQQIRQQSQSQTQSAANFKYDEDSYSLYPPYEFTNDRNASSIALGNREYSVPRKNNPDKINQQEKTGRYFNYNHQPPLPHEPPPNKPPLPRVPPPQHAASSSPYPFYSLAPDTVVSTSGTIQGYIRRSESGYGYTAPKATTKRERAIGPITVPPNKRNRFTGNYGGGNSGGGNSGGRNRGSRGGMGRNNKPNKRERETRRADRSGGGGTGNSFGFGGNNSNNSFQPTKILQRPGSSSYNNNNNNQQQQSQGNVQSQRDELKRSAQEDQANEYAKLMAQFYSEI